MPFETASEVVEFYVRVTRGETVQAVAHEDNIYAFTNVYKCNNCGGYFDDSSIAWNRGEAGPKSKNRIREKARHCPHCNSPDFKNIHVSKEKPKEWHCSNCGLTTRGKERYCKECGERLPAMGEEIPIIGCSESFHGANNDWLMLFTSHIGKIIDSFNVRRRRIIYIIGILEKPYIAISCMMNDYKMKPLDAKAEVLTTWANFEDILEKNNYIARRKHYAHY